MNVLVRLGVAVAFALAIVTPQVASADELTPSQMATLTTGTKNYYRALASGDSDTLAKMTTPDFTIIGKDGKPISTGKVAGQVQAVKLDMRNFITNVNVKSASVSGGVVTEIVQLNGQATTMTGENSGTVTKSSTRRLTWVKSPSGKWLLSKDVVV
jgi:ketosteroid isomerase-like protein